MIAVFFHHPNSTTGVDDKDTFGFLSRQFISVYFDVKKLLLHRLLVS